MMSIIHIWSYNLFFGAADLIMFLRAWAMYDRSRVILIVLLTLYVVEMAPAFILAALDSDSKYLRVSVARVLRSSFCAYEYTQFTPTWTRVVIILQMIYGGVLCMLASAQFARQSLEIYRSTKQWHLNRYMNLLVRQGVVYFFAFFLLNLLNLLYGFHMLPKEGWFTILYLPAELVPAYTLTPRFVLSIRELYVRSIENGHSSKIDAGFGLSGRFGTTTTGTTTMAFEDSVANIGLEETEEVPLQEAREPA